MKDSSLKVAIIGAGDVVQRRLLPALLQYGHRPEDVLIVSQDISEQFELELSTNPVTFIKNRKETKIAEAALEWDGSIFICTPPNSHLFFATFINEANRLAQEEIGKKIHSYALEKPIVSPEDLRTFSSGERQRLGQTFALSYYCLEKALPLVYFLEPRSVYSKFLDFSDNLRLEKKEVLALRNDIGNLESISIWLLEGQERSPVGKGRLWTELPANGGIFFETLIHPVLLIHKLIGSVENLIEIRTRLGVYEPLRLEVAQTYNKNIGPTFVILSGIYENTTVDIFVGKYIPMQFLNRSLIAKFSNGVVSANFDAKSCAITTQDKRIEITVSDKYATNYLVQVNLFHEFLKTGWNEHRFDCLDEQINTLSWLTKYMRKAADYPVISYSAENFQECFPELIHLLLKDKIV